MPDITPKEKELERKPLGKAAKLAMKYAQAQFDREIGSILEGAAEDQGISPEAGWGYDIRTQEWVREVK